MADKIVEIDPYEEAIEIYNGANEIVQAAFKNKSVSAVQYATEVAAVVACITQITIENMKAKRDHVILKQGETLVTFINERNKTNEG